MGICAIAITGMAIGFFISPIMAAPAERAALPEEAGVSSSPDANQIYQEGLSFDQAKNDLEARKAYGKAAAMGHMMAQYRLAEKCLAGKGGSKDIIQGTHMLEMAAEQGGPNMWYAVSRLYLQLGDDPDTINRAYFWLDKAAHRGDAASQALLGSLYVMGKNGEKEYEKAYFWFTLASRKDSQYQKLVASTEKLLTPNQLRFVTKEIEAFRVSK